MSARKPYDRELDDDVDVLKRFLERPRSFMRALRESGLHVGIGNPAQCVTCQVPWPCEFSSLRDERS